MSFDVLCDKLREGPFGEKRQGPGLLSEPFFKFEESDYDRGAESAAVMQGRTEPGTGKLRKKINDEIKLAWMCGMERDRRVQTGCRNYSEIVRGACMLRKIVESRLEHAVKALRKE